MDPLLICSRLNRPLVGLVIVVMLAPLSPGPDECAAQQVIMQGGPGGPMRSFGRPPGAQPQVRVQNNADANKKEEKKPDEEKKDEGEKKEEKKEADSITRSDKPPKDPDPNELKVKPNAQGRVRFGFTGQPWPDVLQWLAGVSGYSLDWQELPKGYLNLTTQRSYTLTEARDLINRHLQARGYVLLLRGEVLSVVKKEKLDPSMVPRVSEDDLYDLQPYDYVKLTFELPEGMEVKQAVEDVKHALSKPPQVMPLTASKRILVIDSVANLRMVSALLNEERLEQEGLEIPRQFPLRFARAEKVINTLYVVLGLDPAAQPSQMELQIQQQKMQLLMQMQGSGKDVTKLLNKDGPPVFLAFNRHENSILANAPEREMKIIERTIKMLDIPAPGSAVNIGASDQAERFPKTYQLEAIEPDSLILSLEEIGNLDPLTELRGDKKAKILFARASTRDHERIEEIIEQLDGARTSVEVFWLRRHPADAVAGTIAAVLGGKKEKKEDSSRRRYFSFWGGRDEEEEEEEIELRVDADIENNRLIVRGNKAQIAEVRDLLVQIGELPGRGTMANIPPRVFEALDRSTTDDLLKQLRSAWPALGGGSQLIINDNRSQEEEKSPSRDAEAEQQPAEQEPTTDRTTRRPPSSRFQFSALPDEVEAGEGEQDNSPANSDNPTPATATADSEQPPVTITITKDGRLMLGGDDQEALARLERMIESLAPPEETFKEYRLSHVSARYVHGKLEDFYEDILAAGKQARYDIWGEYQGTERKQITSRMSQRRPLRMVYNVVTNSIVVTNASQAQLNEIERLINIWDQPPKDDLVFQRRFGMVPIRYSRATNIAKALKEVYRDLLSARDKEFDTEEEKGGGFTTEKLTQIEYSAAEPSDFAAGRETQKTKAIETTFDGVLSIGVDEVANILLISADSELYESVIGTIRQLDEEAKPTTTVEVRRVGVSAEALRKALSESLGTPWTGGRPEQAGAQQQDDQRERDDRDRDRDRRRRDRRDRRDRD